MNGWEVRILQKHFSLLSSREPSRSTQTRKSPRGTKLQSFAEWAGWAWHLKGRDLLTWKSLDEKSPTHRIHTHSPPQLTRGSLQIRCGDFWKWTVSRYNSLWPDFEFIKGIPIGFLHLTSNNGAVSLLIEDSPNPWQMLGGAREMQVKRREPEPGGIPSLVLGEKWLTQAVGWGVQWQGERGWQKTAQKGAEMQAWLGDRLSQASSNSFFSTRWGQRGRSKVGEGLTCLSCWAERGGTHQTDRWL